MVRVDALARQSHWLDHLAPVWKALKPAQRGSFYIWPNLEEHAKKRRIPKVKLLPSFPQWGPYTLVASESDRGKITHGRVIRFEHGAGFSFGGGMSELIDRHPSYAGGRDQRNVGMFLNPNHWADDRWKLHYPETPSFIIGSPKMDRLAEIPPPTNDVPVVALTWHWDAIACPETRSAFKFYRASIKPFLKRTDIRIVGHCHPRGRKMMQPWFEQYDIEFIDDLEDTFAIADVWVNDASSTLYEAAALGKPVVVLNAPWYRREIHHGLRFWERSDIGPVVWQPGELNAAVDQALDEPPHLKDYREQVAEEVFPNIGKASKLAASYITDYVEDSWRTSSTSASA